MKGGIEWRYINFKSAGTRERADPRLTEKTAQSAWLFEQLYKRRDLQNVCQGDRIC